MTKMPINRRLHENFPYGKFSNVFPKGEEADNA